MRASAIYTRVSTFDQEPENQIRKLRLYVELGTGPPFPWGSLHRGRRCHGPPRLPLTSAMGRKKFLTTCCATLRPICAP